MEEYIKLNIQGQKNWPNSILWIWIWIFRNSRQGGSRVKKKEKKKKDGC